MGVRSARSQSEGHGMTGPYCRRFGSCHPLINSRHHSWLKHLISQSSVSISALFLKRWPKAWLNCSTSDVLPFPLLPQSPPCSLLHTLSNSICLCLPFSVYRRPRLLIRFFTPHALTLHKSCWSQPAAQDRVCGPQPRLAQYTIYLLSVSSREQHSSWWAV